MKTLNDFISEKLSLNSNKIINQDKLSRNEIAKSILDHFGIDDESDEWRHYIHDWVEKNNISQVFYYADWDVLDNAREAEIPEKIISDFNSGSEELIACQDELENCKTLVSDGTLSIQANKNMIAYVADDGAAYAVRCEIDKINSSSK